MKKWMAVVCVALVATSAWAAKTMNVQVREGQLRSRASFLGSVTGKVAYGDRVTVKQSQAGWCQVTTATGASGWIHESALTRKRVAMNSGASDARIGASGAEVALAGKGFSQEIEAAYKEANVGIDYTWVDWMGRQKVSDAHLIRFLKQGDLAQ